MARNFDVVFRSWDAVVSWNRWSIDWSNLTFPYQNRGYPQVIPANIGLIYLLSGSIDHQIYGRILHAALVLVPTILFVDLYRMSGRIRYLAATVAYGYALFHYRNDMFDGYMDVPVASISFAFCYFWLLTRYVRPNDARTTMVAAVLLSAAGLVKQSGLFITAYFGAAFGVSSTKSKVTATLMAVVVLLSTWYLVFQVRAVLGYDESNVAYI